jgi:hypothetical protein
MAKKASVRRGAVGKRLTATQAATVADRLAGRDALSLSPTERLLLVQELDRMTVAGKPPAPGDASKILRGIRRRRGGHLGGQRR